MKRIGRKLGSKRGASITFALLLFLVCAVVSSVVIVAATAAGGRLSRASEVDQRYYAVTSAAGFLKDMIDGQTVSVQKVTRTKITTTYNYNEATGVLTPGTSVETRVNASNGALAPDEPENIKFYEGDSVDSAKEITEATETILSHAAKLIIADKESVPPAGGGAGGTGGGDSGDSLPADAGVSGENDIFEKHTMSLTASAVGSLTIPDDSTFTQEQALDALKVSVNEILDKEGTISLYVSKAEQSEGETESTRAFTLKLTFALEMNTVENSHTEYGTIQTTQAEGSDAITYTQDDFRDDVTTITLKWTMVGIEKSSVPKEETI